MTDKQLAILLREYVGRIRSEVETALAQLPDEAKSTRKFALTNQEDITAPALEGFESFAQDLATAAEMLEREGSR
jgi:hypothetical protein